MKTDNPERGQAHWLLVEALGLPPDTVQPGASVDDAQWAKLVESVRRQRFGSLEESEGFLAVGVALGENLLESGVGRALKETLSRVTPERAWSHVLPQMGLRLRQPQQTRFELTGPAGGRLEVTGRRALHRQVTVGLMQVLGRTTVPPSQVRLGEVTDERLVLEIAWG